MNYALVEKNRAFLVKKGVEHSVFVPTETGLRKSILDATRTVRTHFELTGFHDYSMQPQGPEFKAVRTGYLVTSSTLIPSYVSLYRPVTKKGDPRMWFRRLAELAGANDHIAILIYANNAYLFNLSRMDLEYELYAGSSAGHMLAEIIGRANPIALELLNKLQQLAPYPIPAVVHGDTAVGMAVENALGILPNPSKEPDYRGIELKSFRTKKAGSQVNRVNLFAQVADWSISQLKSSREILNVYGYEVGAERKLYCTVSARGVNSQGLYFLVEPVDDLVKECHVSYNGGTEVAAWRGATLRQRLKEKH